MGQLDCLDSETSDHVGSGLVVGCQYLRLGSRRVLAEPRWIALVDLSQRERPWSAKLMLAFGTA